MKLLNCVVLALATVNAFADAPGREPQRPSQPPPLEQPQEQQPVEQPPREEYFDPGQQYYCVEACEVPPMPYPPLVVVPVPPPRVYVRPYYAPPVRPYYSPPVRPYAYPVRPYAPPVRPYRPAYPVPHGYGRPGFGRPGYGYGPRPMPYGGRPAFRRMSAQGCEVQQNNNGEFVVLSIIGDVIYQDSSKHAEINAEAMKTYYEKSDFGLCRIGTDARDI